MQHETCRPAEDTAAGQRTAGAPSALGLSAARRDGTPVLELTGRLEGRDVGAVEDLLTRVLTSDQSVVPVDLSRLEYLSPEAVHALAGVAATRPRCPAPVVLCAASGQPAAVLSQVPAARALPRYDTVEQALADPRGDLSWSQLTLTCDLNDPRAARRFVAHTCAAWELDAVVDEATLLASELVANAALHAGGAVQVVLQRCRGQLTIAVRDGSAARPVGRRASSVDESGRGLFLVDVLSCADGSYGRPDGGKVVWCTIRLPAAS
jgi:hypothetical protein